MQWRRQALRPLLAELKKDFSRQVQEAREPLPLLSSSSRGPPAHAGLFVHGRHLQCSIAKQLGVCVCVSVCVSVCV